MYKSFSRFPALVAVAGLAFTAGCGGGGQAELDDSPEAEAFRFRQSVMTVIGYKILPVADMAREDIPLDEALFTKSVNDLATMAGMTTEGFMPQGIPDGSRATPEIWENWSDFEQKARDFEMAAQALADAVESGGFAAAQGLVQPLQQTCGGCHRPYRAPEQ